MKQQSVTMINMSKPLYHFDCWRCNKAYAQKKIENLWCPFCGYSDDLYILIGHQWLKVDKVFKQLQKPITVDHILAWALAELAKLTGPDSLIEYGGLRNNETRDNDAEIQGGPRRGKAGCT